MAALADSQAIALATGRRPATIRSWASRGLLPRHGTDTRGRTLYDIAEAQQLAARLTLENPLTMCNTEAPARAVSPSGPATAPILSLELTMSSWSLNASGQIPAMAPADPSADPAAEPAAQNVVNVEAEFYEALKAVLEDPQYGTMASSFMGSHVSGSLHQPDA